MKLGQAKRIILLIFLIIVFWIIWFGLDATGIFNTDDNAQVHNLVICADEVVSPGGPNLVLYGGYKSDLFVCGELQSKYTADLIFVWFRDGKGIYQDYFKISPGSFRIQWPPNKYLEPGDYRIEIWYWHRLRGQVDFRVIAEP